MGTDYTLIKKNGRVVELSEHSNVLDLMVTKEAVSSIFDEGIETIVKDLTPAEVVAAGLEMLKVASYWCDDEEFRRHVLAYVGTYGGAGSYEASLIHGMSEAIQPGRATHGYRRAAELIEQTVVKDTAEGKRLAPRQAGNQDGLYYAEAIRALARQEG